MVQVFNKETITTASTHQDIGKIKEVDKHQLLHSQDNENPIVTFDQVKQMGGIFLSQDFNAVAPLPGSKLYLELIQRHIKRHALTGTGAFWGRLALGPDDESQFPVTIELVHTQKGTDLRLHIVPIHYGALKVSQYGQHNVSLLALAAAAATAPQFGMEHRGGISTTNCSTKKETVTSITPDHATPLVVVFDSFQQGNTTLRSAISVTGDRNLSIKRAGHLHGQSAENTQLISNAATGSKLAAGVPIRTVLRSELTKHVLFIQTNIDEYGNENIVTLNETIWKSGVVSENLSLMAAALGFTARVIGETDREKTIESVLRPEHADTPLVEVVRK